MDYKIIAVVIIVVTIGLASRFIFKMPSNNFVERAAEEVIKDETGHDFDIEEIVDCVEDLEPSDKKE